MYPWAWQGNVLTQILAAASAAGLAAYFLSIRELDPFDAASAESPKALKAYMLQLAHNRGGDSSLNLYYNGIRPSDIKDREEDAPVSFAVLATFAWGVFLSSIQSSTGLIDTLSPRVVGLRGGSATKAICLTGRTALARPL